MITPPESPSWPLVISTLLRGHDLDSAAASWAMDQAMTGSATPAQLAGFLVALRAKGETVEEMDALAGVMLAHAERIEVPGPALDVVGTGGDLARTVNISTMAALVAAGAGATVVKHGNRAASSECGTADVLEELGLDLTLRPDQVESVAKAVGITFCFAPVHHPAMRHAGPIRRELGVVTSFNFLGPLSNPAAPAAQAIGCSDPRMAALMAEVFARRGASALVFRGDDGLDEITTTTTSRVWVVGTDVAEVTLDPRDLGVPFARPDDLVGGDRATNAAVVRRVLDGEVGPVRDAVVLNAAAALVALDAVADPIGDPLGGGLLERLDAAVGRAGTAIDSGAARETLDRWLAAVAEVAEVSEGAEEAEEAEEAQESGKPTTPVAAP